ncbi:MAG: elongation factor Ts [Bacteroidales bacterium]|nr:elongation factor Ts [Bacteroidales bacterium]
MAQISVKEITRLRKTTGAGMMDCKNALEESGGDFNKAIEIIRKKGQAVANKRADREASQGVVLAKVTDNGTLGVMIVLNCETDFVAKNQNFIGLAEKIVDVALKEKPTDLDALTELSLEGKTVSEKILEQVGIIGEKIELAYYDKLEAEMVIPYIHPGNMLATLVAMNKKCDPRVGKDIAMQVAAMNPVAVDKDDVPAEVLEKEREIGREQALREGKPENIVDRIAEGKLQKFFKESTLLNQDFTRDNKKTIRQYIQESDKSLEVKAFRRYSLNL